MTLTSQYIKFITETQRRLEDDEVITHSEDTQQQVSVKTHKHKQCYTHLLADWCMGNLLSSITSKVLAQKKKSDSVSHSVNLLRLVRTAFSGEANCFIQVFQTSHPHYSIRLSFPYTVYLVKSCHIICTLDSDLAAGISPEFSHVLQLLDCFDLVFASLFPLEITHTCDLKVSVWLPAFSDRLSNLTFTFSLFFFSNFLFCLILLTCSPVLCHDEY